MTGPRCGAFASTKERLPRAGSKQRDTQSIVAGPLIRTTPRAAPPGGDAMAAIVSCTS
jgi:hypothetical protein